MAQVSPSDAQEGVERGGEGRRGEQEERQMAEKGGVDQSVCRRLGLLGGRWGESKAEQGTVNRESCGRISVVLKQGSSPSYRMLVQAGLHRSN